MCVLSTEPEQQHGTSVPCHAAQICFSHGKWYLLHLLMCIPRRTFWGLEHLGVRGHDFRHLLLLQTMLVYVRIESESYAWLCCGLEARLVCQAESFGLMECVVRLDSAQHGHHAFGQ